MVEFHQTVMGKQFYDSVLPSLVKELRALNGNFRLFNINVMKIIQYDEEQRAKLEEQKPKDW